MPQNYIQLTYPYPYKNISGTASTTLSNTYGGIGAIPAADGNGVLYPVNTVAPAYNSALTFSNTNVAPVFTPILSGGSNIVTAPSLGSVGYVLSVAAGNTTAWVTVSSLPAGNASTLENATWESPGTIGSTTPTTGVFTQVTATSMSNSGYYDVSGKTAGQTDIFRFGNTSANNNKGVIDWNYIGSGSTSNSIGFGFWGANNILKLNAGGLITLTVPSGTTNICDMLIPTLAGSATRRFGQATSTGDQMIETFNYTSANSASNYYSLAVGSNALQLSNSTSTATTLASPLTSTGVLTGTQLTSNVAIGTAPLVITSTTLVPNLYVARSVLSDTATTNANLTGDITSSGNATTYNNPLPIAIGGTGGTGGFASPTAIGGSTPNTGAFTSLTSTLASATAFTVAGNQSSDTVPVATITNSNTAPKNMLSMLAANTTSGNQVYMQIGQSLTAGNAAGVIYEYHGSNNAATYMGLQFYGAGGANLKLYNSTSSATTLNTPFSATSYQSTATLGTALSSMFKAPQVVLCLAGTSGALAIPSPVPLYAKITMFGGGGGGAGCNGASSVGGSNGGNTSIQFNSNFTSVNGGTPGTSTVPGTGGTIGTTNVGYGFQYSIGGDGSYGTSTGVFFQGGRGGNSFTNPASQTGNTGLMPGAGGKGGDSANLIQSNSCGGGGGGGITFFDTPPIGYYDYIVGSGGAGGAGGTSTGGTGGGGQIQIVYYWQ